MFVSFETCCIICCLTCADSDILAVVEEVYVRKVDGLVVVCELQKMTEPSWLLCKAAWLSCGAPYPCLN